MGGVSFSKQGCIQFMDTYCEAARQKEIMTLNADWKYAANQSIAAFLITRPPIAYVGKIPTALLQLQPGIHRTQKGSRSGRERLSLCRLCCCCGRLWR